MPMTSCASKATACTRFRWARCTPASSNPGTSASRSSARRCCGSRSGSATCTRASSGASPSCRFSRVIVSRRAYRAIPPSRSRGPIARRSKGSPASEIPPRAAWLRALCLELERIANHLGDLGALGNDAGFAFGLAQFSRLKEGVLRATEQALGQRYLLDVVVPGGVRVDRVERAPCRNSRAASHDVVPRGADRCATSTTSTPACGIDSSAPAW